MDSSCTLVVIISVVLFPLTCVDAFFGMHSSCFYFITSNYHSRYLHNHCHQNGRNVSVKNQIHSSRSSTCVRHYSTYKSTEIESPSTFSKTEKPSCKIVLVAGFESFNRKLYENAVQQLSSSSPNEVQLQVFSDSEIRSGASIGVKGATEQDVTNPQFARAMKDADIFIGSLIFDYDDVMALEKLLPNVKGPRLLFECATELMTFNKVGSFSMAPSESTSNGRGTAALPGPPPAVKAILSKFSSGKEEDKINGYLKLLKVGPDLLKFVPGEKAGDLRTWLEAYRYWNQGGLMNASSMFQLLYRRTLSDYTAEDHDGGEDNATLIRKKKKREPLPKVEITPDIGLLHPLLQDRISRTDNMNNDKKRYFTNPKEYVAWRESDSLRKRYSAQSMNHTFHLASNDAPRVAILLYRKHVITNQPYIYELISQMEQNGIFPIPIFINGVEAHTIVRDLLTSDSEMRGVKNGEIVRDSTFQNTKAVRVDAIVNTVGFPLVGGPAGSVEAGRNVEVAERLLSDMNVPYFVASPLLLQSIDQWKKNGVLGLQSVVLYSLPELDGAIDTVVLGGLNGDEIQLIPERVTKLTQRVEGWVKLRRTKKSEKSVAVMVYGFPPNVGAVGTAALLDVPRSLENLLRRLDADGYDTGEFSIDSHACGESLIAALSILNEDSVISAGAERMQQAVDDRIIRAIKGDSTVAATLAKPGGGLGGAKVRAFNVNNDQLENVMGKYMFAKVKRAWPEKDGRCPGIAYNGDMVVAGLEIGNVWIGVQPLLGVEGDPMRLLFERDLTPHFQYCATYEFMRRDIEEGGIGSQAVIHLGMHGTVEWLPGQPLGNDRESWSDELVGNLPNIYIYAANNPSESILAKRRGYGTLVSYNVPPYGRAGLYLELANLRDLVSEYRTLTEIDVNHDLINATEENNREDLRSTIWSSCQRCGMNNDVPLLAIEGDTGSIVTDPDLPPGLSNKVFNSWILLLSEYMTELQDRLFSSGLHTLGSKPSDKDLLSYLEAYFGDKMDEKACLDTIVRWRSTKKNETSNDIWKQLQNFVTGITTNVAEASEIDDEMEEVKTSENDHTVAEAREIISLLERNTEELDGVMIALDGGYVPPRPGGDLLRDGTAVLPTGRNIHALDPYRMPSAGACARGQRIADETIKQHLAVNRGQYPETVAVTLWGLDAIKTRGESIAIILGLIGAKAVKEGTGRVVRYDLVPLEELKRPRIDVLASLSGIFRDSFANVVDQLDDMFERCAVANEPESMNFVKKHANELKNNGVAERSAARLFSNPPGDYGSMVNEMVGSSEWSDEESLGEIWTGRNSFSYGRNEGDGGNLSGRSSPLVLEKLLSTTERIVQEIDSVEYGLTDIQEYYANTGALKKAAENRKPADPKTNLKKPVAVSVVEAFGSRSQSGGDSNEKNLLRDLEDVLRLEYRSKLLNPKWRDAMLSQGSGGAYEVSQRMTAMIGWSATTGEVDNFVFDQAAERYALDGEVARKLQEINPEAFKNIVRRLLEAEGRGMWKTDDETLTKLNDLYSDADDLVEQIGSSISVSK